MNAKQQGKIVKWFADKGYGFIAMTGQAEMFFHISEFKAPRQPQIGDTVEFELTTDQQGRQQAICVQEVTFVRQQVVRKNKQQQRAKNNKHRPQNNTAINKSRLALSMGMYGVLALLAWQHQLPWLVAGWYALLGVISFGLYAKDKAAAQTRQWRTPEQTLHVVDALGGWMGGMLAQSLLRHKTQKASFRFGFYVSVIINLAALLVLLTNPQWLLKLF